MPVYQDPLRGVSFSEAYAEAMASAGIDDAELVLLEIYHPDLAEPLYLVLNDEDVTATLEAGAPRNASTAVLHHAIRLGHQLPEESDEAATPQARFWIDGVSSLVAAELEAAAQSLEPVELVVRSYMSSDLTAPAVLPPLQLELHDINVGETRVLATAAFADHGNRRFPGKVFLPAEYPTVQPR
jgi:hypothetical protein